MFPWLARDQEVIQLTHDPENVIYATSYVHVIGSQPVAKQTQCVHDEPYALGQSLVVCMQTRREVDPTVR